MKTHCHWRQAALGLLCAFCCLQGPASAHPSAAGGGTKAPLPKGVSAADDTDGELDQVLTREAWRVMEDAELLPGQRRGGTVSAHMDLGTGIITVTFSVHWLPSSVGGDLEDQLDQFRHALDHLASKVATVKGLDYRVGGRSLWDYFPEIQEEDERARARGDARRLPGSGIALVAAGHGYYFRNDTRTWTAQRDPVNGILEDTITPLYAEELKHWMEARSRMPVIRPRSTSAELHAPSLQEWWKVAAKYHLAVQYPQNPEIWDSLPPSDEANHDRKEDIRSRPLLANHQRADVAMHLHTNGAQPAARGTRLLVQPGRPVDAALGNSVLCYMKELINSQDGYPDFPVSADAMLENKGETRLAEMPAIIIESAFHTNPSDAAALQDPVFRAAAMKGVEKGYRLHREGQGCQPLLVDRITDVVVPGHGRATVEVHFKGYPQFPVTLDVQSADCMPGWVCSGGEVVLTEATASPLRFDVECDSGEGGTARWRTTMRDADNVKGEPSEHQQTCLPGRAPTLRGGGRVRVLQ